MSSASSLISPTGGHPHCQRAPTSEIIGKNSHWILSYNLAFASDLERLRGTIKRINRSPLGRSALVGNPFDVDRDMMAEELGFEGHLWNSMGGVADRDFVTELFEWGSMLMQHISC
ncbi:argininosuccinate lyase [Fusarium albosuccineum]|uniref:Argininosuccinate lyase n=1 Tax=Fusarium albosuccineum TaxID=1237068 RepID=A0A8H4KW18_9HYPO|nr:argininosuccinate lyase [Fusarium albosuccineum]